MTDREFNFQYGQPVPTASHDEEEEHDHFPSSFAGNVDQVCLAH